MTRNELETLLNTLGIQVFYNHTTQKDVVNLPFIVYLDNIESFYTDNITYCELPRYSVILHSAERNETLEAQIKALFTNNGIAYEVSGIDWEEDILMWVVSFEI